MPSRPEAVTVQITTTTTTIRTVQPTTTTTMIRMDLGTIAVPATLTGPAIITPIPTDPATTILTVPTTTTTIRMDLRTIAVPATITGPAIKTPIPTDPATIPTDPATTMPIITTTTTTTIRMDLGTIAVPATLTGPAIKTIPTDRVETRLQEMIRPTVQVGITIIRGKVKVKVSRGQVIGSTRE